MKYTIEFSEWAIETSEAIHSQLYHRWGEKITTDFEERTVKVLRLIESSPFTFPAADLDPTVRRALIHRNCSVFYEVKDYKMTILFFSDNRQDPIF